MPAGVAHAATRAAASAISARLRTLRYCGLNRNASVYSSIRGV